MAEDVGIKAYALQDLAAHSDSPPGITFETSSDVETRGRLLHNDS